MALNRVSSFDSVACVPSFEEDKSNSLLTKVKNVWAALVSWMQAMWASVAKCLGFSKEIHPALPAYNLPVVASTDPANGESNNQGPTFGDLFKRPENGESSNQGPTFGDIFKRPANGESNNQGPTFDDIFKRLANGESNNQGASYN